MDIMVAVVVISVVEVVILSLAFRSFERAEDRRAAVALGRSEADRSRSRFFAESPGLPAADNVPLDALLARLERHVRLEQQAAEWFLANPTRETLHHRGTTRPQLTH